MCSKSESGFPFQFEKHGRWKIQIFYEHEDNTPAESIQTCVHQRRLGEAKRHSYQI